jgi:hypothetical protein
VGENTKATNVKEIIMTTDEHFLLMGKLVVNLQSLEYALRGFLYNEGNGWRTDPNPPEFLENINKEDLVSENAFTNYDTLGTLISKYNGIIKKRDQRLCVDEELVNLRDALVHGRIAKKTPSPSEPCMLVKYDKPQNDKVRVTHCITLTKDWFDKQIRFVSENVHRVAKAAEIVEAEHKT